MEVGGQRHAPATLPSEVSPGVHCTGGCVVHRVGLDGRGGKKISCLHRGSNPNTPSVISILILSSCSHLGI